MSDLLTFPIWQVDAFSSSVFGGNPAAVVAVDGPWPDDDVLQAIAAENNVSETAFFRTDECPTPLRWFTPTLEVPLCGHATLATVAVMHEILGLVSVGSIVELATASGPLYVDVKKDGYVIDLPARRTERTTMPIEQFEIALGVKVNEVWESVDRYVCILESEEAVRAVKPDLALIASMRLLGLIVTALGDDSDFVSRYFAPSKGVPEDPVTGTSHCTLAPFWGHRLGKKDLFARQLSQRGGEIHCSLNEDRVRLAGACRFYLQGSIVVPTICKQDT